jgi:uncharacterized membrane protein
LDDWSTTTYNEGHFTVKLTIIFITLTQSLSYASSIAIHLALLQSLKIIFVG